MGKCVHVRVCGVGWGARLRWYPMAWYPMAWYIMAQYLVAWYPMARYPMAWYPMAWYPMAWYPNLDSERPLRPAGPCLTCPTWA